MSPCWSDSRLESRQERYDAVKGDVGELDFWLELDDDGNCCPGETGPGLVVDEEADEEAVVLLVLELAEDTAELVRVVWVEDTVEVEDLAAAVAEEVTEEEPSDGILLLELPEEDEVMLLVALLDAGVTVEELRALGLADEFAVVPLAVEVAGVGVAGGDNVFWTEVGACVVPFEVTEPEDVPGKDIFVVELLGAFGIELFDVPLGDVTADVGVDAIELVDFMLELMLFELELAEGTAVGLERVWAVVLLLLDSEDKVRLDGAEVENPVDVDDLKEEMLEVLLLGLAELDETDDLVVELLLELLAGTVPDGPPVVEPCRVLLGLAVVAAGLVEDVGAVLVGLIDAVKVGAEELGLEGEPLALLVFSTVLMLVDCSELDEPSDFVVDFETVVIAEEVVPERVVETPLVVVSLLELVRDWKLDLVVDGNCCPGETGPAVVEEDLELKDDVSCLIDDDEALDVDGVSLFPDKVPFELPVGCEVVVGAPDLLVCEVEDWFA
ncbi:hypothetical protein KVT40_001341 [Elsinoe batatas]|uniref:Uncharacterized protein n=1 Tax=Elsinoe batatas TaxID=2601811 RepID=A0A8K0L5T0_9PEZI|nr:hypothetical protein KVT40_001341 [Elsinoe batatas]